MTTYKKCVWQISHFCIFGFVVFMSSQISCIPFQYEKKNWPPFVCLYLCVTQNIRVGVPGFLSLIPCFSKKLALTPPSAAGARPAALSSLRSLLRGLRPLLGRLRWPCARNTKKSDQKFGAKKKISRFFFIFEIFFLNFYA